MSWVTEDWTSGLTGQVLQKVKELQALNEKLSRERQQRQLQLDNSEVALHKQKQKYEEVRVELAAVQRELVGVHEQAQGEMRSRERLAQDLQAKVTQVCSLEGQLDAAKRLSQNLTLEVKRQEAELEKLQKESVSGNSVLFSTPCWNMNSPLDQNGKDVFRGEVDSQAQHVRQQLLFTETPKPSVGVAPSPYPQRLHNSPPLQRRVDQSVAHTPSALFPWERDEAKPTPSGRPTSVTVSSFPSVGVVIADEGSRDDAIGEALRNEIDGLRVRVSGLQQELQLEKECRREIESRLVQTQKELNTIEQILTRSRDELARAQTKITQEDDKARAAEQRVKQLQEELKCQRQNAETSRCNAEQRRKEMEREHQKELQGLQKEKQSMERQHQQEINKLNQEIQQARTLHNALQTQYDKLTLQKQVVERDLEEVQGKLKNTQAELTEVQKSETRLQAKLMESLKENEAQNVSIQQLMKREKSLEAEVKRLTEELAEALQLIKELQAKLAAPPTQAISHSFTPVPGDSFNSTHSILHEHSLHHQHSMVRKKTPKTERVKGSNRPGPLTYPSDREPGEGIDSEDISEFESKDSPSLSLSGQEGNQPRAGRSGESEVEHSITEQDTGIGDTDTDSYMSDSISDCVFKDDIKCDSRSSKGNGTEEKKQNSSSLVELKKENSILQDELRDIKRELAHRLEDLETQRQSETAARTKLKQLSKKQSSQSEQHRIKTQELKEKESKLEAQLELEKKESARFRDVVAALESEAGKTQKEVEREKSDCIEENSKLREVLAERERMEEQLVEESEKLRKDLEVLQSELLQERDEREKDRQEMKKTCDTNEVDALKKIAELQAELDCLHRAATVELKNMNETTFNTKCDSGSNCTVEKHSTVEQGCSSAGNVDQSENKDLDNTTVLVLELEHMRVQRDREAERAKKAQKNLEALQSQVTGQTQQLTLAFENQSKHIEGLLKELQERDNALQRQREELQVCLQELASVKRMREDERTTEVMLGDASSTDELTEQEASQTANNTTLQHFKNVEVMDETDKVNATSDKSISTKKDVSLPASDVHAIDTEHITKNTTANELLKEETTAQQGNGHVVDSNTKDTDSSVILSPSKPNKNYTHNIDALKTVINELLEPNNEVAQLKNDQRTLVMQVSVQDYLAIKHENEHLKQKLKLLDTEPHMSEELQSPEVQSTHLTNIKEQLPSRNKAGHCGGASSLEEEEEIRSSKKEASHSKVVAGNENKASGVASPSAPVHSVQEQLQDLQTQLQLLSEQNKEQAEELVLWRLSAMSPGETMDQKSNNRPIVLVREEQLLLSCNPTVQHVHNSSMLQLGGYFGFEAPDHHQDDQSLSEQTAENMKPIIKAAEQITDDSAINIINDHLKSQRSTGGLSVCAVLSEKVNDQHALPQQMSLTKTINVAYSPESQSQENTFSPESQGFGLFETTFKSIVIDSKHNTGSVKSGDSNTAGLNQTESVILAQHCEAPESLLIQENIHAKALVSQAKNSVLQQGYVEIKESGLDQDRRFVTEATGSPNQARTKKVKNLLPQTLEESCQMKIEYFESCSLLQQESSVLTASPQTNTTETILIQQSPTVLSTSPQTNTEQTVLLQQGQSTLSASPQTNAKNAMFTLQSPSVFIASSKTNAEPKGLIQQGQSALTASPQTNAKEAMQSSSVLKTSPQTNTEQTVLLQQEQSGLTASPQTNTKEVMLTLQNPNILTASPQTNTEQTVLLQQEQSGLTASPQTNTKKETLTLQSSNILTESPQTNTEQTVLLQQEQSGFTASPLRNTTEVMLTLQSPNILTASPQTNTEQTGTERPQDNTEQTGLRQHRSSSLLQQEHSGLTASPHTNAKNTMLNLQSPNVFTASPQTNTEQTVLLQQVQCPLTASPQINTKGAVLVQQSPSVLNTNPQTNTEQTVLLQQEQNGLTASPETNTKEVTLTLQSPNILTASPQTNTEQTVLLRKEQSSPQTNAKEAVLVQQSSSVLNINPQTNPEQMMLLQQGPSVFHASTQTNAELTMLSYQRLSVIHASTQTNAEQMHSEESMEKEDRVTGSPTLSPTPASTTGNLLFSGSFPIPSNPAHLAERIRRNRSRMSVAYDDTEYEPYGLPEVVMKGFADIPTGPACPYVLRRGLLGTDTLSLSLKDTPLKEEDEEIDP